MNQNSDRLLSSKSLTIIITLLKILKIKKRRMFSHPSFSRFNQIDLIAFRNVIAPAAAKRTTPAAINDVATASPVCGMP